MRIFRSLVEGRMKGFDLTLSGHCRSCLAPWSGLWIATAGGFLSRGRTYNTFKIVDASKKCLTVIMRRAREARWRCGRIRELYNRLEVPTAHVSRWFLAACGFPQSDKMAALPPRIFSEEQNHA